MFEELSEPINPKLKDSAAFNSACDDVSPTFFHLIFQILVQLCMCLKWIHSKGPCRGRENLCPTTCMSLTEPG